SSSHTVGPMNAAREFAQDLESQGLLTQTAKVGIQLYGSLALTGHGHGTDRAVLIGLEGNRPDEVDPDHVEAAVQRIRSPGRLRLLGRHDIAFDEPLDLLYLRNQVLPGHSNGMRFSALDASGRVLRQEEFYSIGGGFIVRGGQVAAAPVQPTIAVPYPFGSSAELLRIARESGLEIFEMMLA